jgi:hypothetical protein
MARGKSSKTLYLEWEILSALWFLETFKSYHNLVQNKGTDIRGHLFPATGSSDFPHFTHTLNGLIKEQRVLRMSKGRVGLSVADWTGVSQKSIYPSRGNNLYDLAKFYDLRNQLGYIPYCWHDVSVFMPDQPVEVLPVTEWAILTPHRPQDFRPELAPRPSCYTAFDSNAKECQSCLLSPECRTATVNMVSRWSH